MKSTFSYLLILPFLLIFTSLQANDCSNASVLTLGTPSTVTLDACDNLDLAGGVWPSCSLCSQDAWFQLTMGGTNLVQQNMRFNIEANGSAELNLTLLYSDSWEESGDPCTWSNGTAALGLSRNEWVCTQTITMPGDILEFDTDGLDGSGVYFLLVEKTLTASTATSITVTPVVRSTCNAPSNDRCATPLALSSGNGIDPAAPMPNVPSWSDAMKTSIACATKQRITRATPGDPGTALIQTEDHYSYGFAPRRYTGNIGDYNGVLRTRSDSYLENTVFYSFQLPGGGSGPSTGWNLAIGNTGGCSQEPNNLVAMLFSNLDCNDADNSARITSMKIPMDNGVAAGNPSHTFSSLTLNYGQTYYLVVDGTRASQCDFCILLYNGSTVNPVLPAELTSFAGFNQGRENILQWETSLEDRHDFFSIEKSLDGKNFVEIGQIDGAGNAESGQAYNFIDPSAEVGINYYRLDMVDINGTSFYSKSIEVYREAPQAELISIYPNPSKDQVELLYASDKQAETQISLIDLRGKIVRNLSFSSNPGEQKVKISLADLPAGIYAVKFQIGTYSSTQKLVKL